MNDHENRNKIKVFFYTFALNVWRIDQERKFLGK